MAGEDQQADARYFDSRYGLCSGSDPKVAMWVWSPVEAAYMRDDMFDRRRPMDWWAILRH